MEADKKLQQVQLFLSMFLFSFFLRHLFFPTNKALLINLRLSSDAEIFAIDHRLSTQVGAPNVQNTCTQCVRVQTDLPFLHATVGGWVLIFQTPSYMGESWRCFFERIKWEI